MIRLVSCLCALLIFSALPAGAAGVVNASHLLPPLQFSLSDDTGRPVTARTWHGQTVLVYFGYTGCGDQCPITLTRLAQAVRTLGPDGNKVRILFVTVTPATDTPLVLKSYLAGYGSSRITGLTGDPLRLRALAHRLRAAWPVLSTDPPVHSAAIYVFDADGKAAAIVPADADTATLAQILKPSRP